MAVEEVVVEGVVMVVVQRVVVPRVAVVPLAVVVRHAKVIAMNCWDQQMAERKSVVVVRTGMEAHCA